MSTLIVAGTWMPAIAAIFGAPLAHDLRIHTAADNDDVANGVDFLPVEDVAAVTAEAVANGVIDRIDGNNRLLRGADDAVVEGLRQQNRSDGARLIGRLVDDDRRIAGADADGRLAGRVRGLAPCPDRPWPGSVGSPDDASTGWRARRWARRCQPMMSFGSARGDRRLQHQAGCQAGALAGARRGD